VEAALADMAKVRGEAGAVVLTPDGAFGWAHNSDHFAVAYASSADPEPKVFLKQNGERHG
jgi:beta-aspartyl-peptidase (threonine type)